jgi:transposase
VVACALDGLTGEVTKARLTPDCGDILAWLGRLEGPVRVAYEAGPTGFGLARALEEAGVACVVAAPSKISRAPGDRVKTDARDAMLLARLLRVGDLVAVRVPSPVQEAARDLVRAREDARGDLMRARHRLSKLLLRHGMVYAGGSTWTGVHQRWLLEQARQLSLPGQREAFDADHEAVLLADARRARLDTAIEDLAADSEFTPIVRKLVCLRGVSTLTGFALAVEIGDWDRFTGATIGAFLGLVPTENSSGASRSQGSITKTGNTHARRLLVEAAWHHRRPYRAPSALIRARWKNAPPAAAARAHAGNQRLNARWATFTTRRKRPVVANVAVARELAGWCWSLATLQT